MAKETASTVTAWKKTTATVEVEDTGNILTPLERMYFILASRECPVNEAEQDTFYWEGRNK